MFYPAAGGNQYRDPQPNISLCMERDFRILARGEEEFRQKFQRHLNKMYTIN